ncbi:MAG TPA: DUF188 domain-containing protein [Thermodesulfobacteriota bacterium]
MPTVYLDADAAPNKDIVLAAAARYRLPLVVVSGRPLRSLAGRPGVEVIVAGAAADAADREILCRVAAGDLVLTSDLPLARAAIEKGARVLDFRGDALTDDNIHDRLATRDLMQALRSTGEVSEGASGPAPLTPADRRRFAGAVDRSCAALARGVGRGPPPS